MYIHIWICYKYIPLFFLQKYWPSYPFFYYFFIFFVYHPHIFYNIFINICWIKHNNCGGENLYLYEYYNWRIISQLMNWNCWKYESKGKNIDVQYKNFGMNTYYKWGIFIYKPEIKIYKIGTNIWTQ